MAIGLPPSPDSPGNPWCWPPTRCGSIHEPWDWWLAIEAVETDADNY